MIGQQKTVQTSTNNVSVKSHSAHALSTAGADMVRRVYEVTGIFGRHFRGDEIE
jgi:hypothetical protein